MLQRLSLSTMVKHAGVAPSWRRCAGMTKAGLVNKVAATIQLPRHQTETVVNLFLQCITDALGAGDKVELRGFGSFRLHHRAPRAGRRLRLPPQAQYEALAAAQTWSASEEGQQLYKRRAGVEGTLSQGVRAFGLRRTRYGGLAKTHVQHV